MAKRRVRVERLVDPQTGEIKPFLVIDLQEKDRDFVKVKQALTKTVIERLDYLNGAIKLLFLILDLAIESKIFERPVDIFLTPEIAKERIGISSKDTFYRHIRVLMKAKILIKIRPHVYRLNPEMVWIGDLKSYIRWLREQQQLKLFEEQEKQAEA